MTRAEALAEFDKKLLEETLKREGTITRAKDVLGVNRTYLYRLCARYGIQVPCAPTGHRGNWQGC